MTLKPLKGDGTLLYRLILIRKCHNDTKKWKKLNIKKKKCFFYYLHEEKLLLFI